VFRSVSIKGGSNGPWFYQLVSHCRLRHRKYGQRVHLVPPESVLPCLVGIGKSGEPGNPNPTIYVFTIIAALVQAVFVSFMVNTMGSTTVASGATAGFMLWLGFVAPTNLVNKLFAGHGFKVWAIEAGNHLVNFLLFGAILGAWR